MGNLLSSKPPADRRIVRERRNLAKLSEEKQTLEQQKVHLEKQLEQGKVEIDQSKQEIQALHAKLQATLQELQNKSQIIEDITTKKKRKREDDEEADDNEEDEDEEAPTQTPKKRRRIASKNSATQEQTKPVYIFSASGFRKLKTTPYSKEYKHKVIQLIYKLGGTYIPEESREQREILDPTVTHVIAAPGAKTLKVLQAAALGKWIVLPEWIEKCAEAGEWVDVGDFGFRRAENPIKGKRVAISSGFMENLKEQVASCQAVLDSCGATVVKNYEEADIVFVARKQEKEQIMARHQCVVLEWNEVIDTLYPAILDLQMRSTAAKFAKENIKQE